MSDVKEDRFMRCRAATLTDWQCPMTQGQEATKSRSPRVTNKIAATHTAMVTSRESLGVEGKQTDTYG